MILSFKHKGLKRFFDREDASKLNQHHVRRIRLILTALNAASSIDDMAFPGSGLHALKGNLKGYWSVTVSGNWRIIFRYENGDAYDADYLDYH